MSLLNVQNIAKRYGSVIALRSADLTVEAGEIHALLGANGAGKSTLVKILTGVIRADSGSITLADKPLAVGSPARARDAGLAPVFQDPALVPDLTVRQSMRLTGTSMDGVQASLRSMELSVDPDELVGDLPLAMLRMIDLARALSHDPQLLLLDEITAALPSDLAERVLTVARQLRDRGRSVLFVSHRLAEVTLLCDRATVLRDGRAVGTLKPSTGGEERIVELMLGESHDAIVEEIAQAEETAQADEGEARGQPADADAGPPALRVSGLQLTDASPEGVDFEVRSGEIVGVAALDAQGQEELFNLLAGLQRIRDGQVERLGKPVKPRDPYDAIKAGMVLVPSDRLLALLPDRPIRENIAAPLYSHIAKWGPFNARREAGKVDNAIARLQIDTRARRQARRLSGGNQQKLTIARWLAAGFDVLLCFDPTRGIDVGTKRQIYALLRELAGAGAAVLLFTSELTEIQLVCDRVVVLHDGRISDRLPASDANEARLLRSAHGLVEAGAVS
jgi:ribose transport system ATP-binding protein